MTPEEIRETLFRTLDKLDELYGDRKAYQELIRSEREAHVQEVANFKAEIADKDRNLADKTDANYKVELANQEIS